MIIFSTNNISALAQFTFKERQQIMIIASSLLTTPEKLIINILKLFILIPVFFYVASLSGLLLVVGAFTIILLFLIASPFIVLQFQAKHIDNAIEKYKK